MLLLLPIALFLGIHLNIDAIAPLKPLSALLQRECLGWFTPTKRKDRPENDLSRSFICGQTTMPFQQKTALQKSGLYHAIVVSGGHFIFLESVFKSLRWPPWLRFLGLGCYYLMTGLQAPGLRSLMQLALASGAKTSHLRIGRSSQCFYSGLFCLIISAPLWSSLSFWLSLSVSLALCYSQEILSRKNKALRIVFPMVAIYLFLIPFNFTKGYPHPLSLILGMILLYPFCLTLLLSAGLMILGQIFSASVFYQATDILNKNLFLFLDRCTLIIPDKNLSAAPIFYFWVYLFVLTALTHLFVIRLRRESTHE